MIRGQTSLMDFTRDDGAEVLIEYKLTPYDPGVSYGPPESCYPPEGGEIEEWEATSDGVKVIQLTDAENERVEAEIYKLPPPEYDPQPDDIF